MNVNYGIPKINVHQRERCRDCAEKKRTDGYGISIECKLLGMFVRHSHRCESWHPPGSLF